jgi:hypothetical protein
MAALLIALLLLATPAVAADNNPFSGASGIRVTMVRDMKHHRTKSKACHCLWNRRSVVRAHPTVPQFQ